MIKNKMFLNILTLLIVSAIAFSGNAGNASIGSVTIDGKIYNQISCDPNYYKLYEIAFFSKKYFHHIYSHLAFLDDKWAIFCYKNK